MAAQRCETLSGFDWDVVAATQSSRYAALRGNPGLPYASPSGYFIYRNFLRTNAQKADGLFRAIKVLPRNLAAPRISPRRSGPISFSM
jgi:hypothetical protein